MSKKKGPRLVCLPAMGRLGFPALCERYRGGSGIESPSEGFSEAASWNTGPKIDGAQDAAPLREPA